MVIDTSALVAILTNEIGAEDLERAIELDPIRLVSAATLLETSMVIEARYGLAGGRELDLLLHAAQVDVVPVNQEQAELARRAWRAYGRGRHPARLNYGDLFSYALAKVSGEALLFVGADFAHTDVPRLE